MRKIAVAGAGMMGKNIAFLFTALPSCEVTVYNHRVKDFYKETRDGVQTLVEGGILTEEEADARVHALRFTTDLADGGIADADLIIESIPEELARKKAFFAELEPLVRKDAILCSNSSVISPTEISADLAGKSRFIGMHFWNPAHLIPLVEIIRTPFTADSAVESASELLKKAGKHPVVCKKDVPGFIGNRLMHAFWREALYMIDNGIADAADIDDAVKNSFALRLPFLGPTENMDMVGTQLVYNVQAYLDPFLSDEKEPSPTLKKLLAEEKYGFKNGEGLRTWSEEETERSKRDLERNLIMLLKETDRL